MDHSNHMHGAVPMAASEGNAMAMNSTPAVMADMHGNVHAAHNMLSSTDDQSMDHGMSMPMEHMMKMYFHTTFMNETVLFQQWQINSVSSLVGSCVGIFLFALLYEGFKVFRAYLAGAVGNCDRCNSKTATHTMKHTDSTVPMIQNTSSIRCILSCSHVVQTGLHVVQVLASYLLMLVFMTYNVYLCLAVLAGATVGFFLFGWQRSIAATATSGEHCN